MKIRSNGSRVTPVGRTDRHGEGNSCILKFRKAPKMLLETYEFFRKASLTWAQRSIMTYINISFKSKPYLPAKFFLPVFVQNVKTSLIPTRAACLAYLNHNKWLMLFRAQHMCAYRYAAIFLLSLHLLRFK
jgi:hypothetical protein